MGLPNGTLANHTDLYEQLETLCLAEEYLVSNGGDIVSEFVNSHVPHFSWQTLLITTLGKMASLGVALGFGFIGGQIFPFVFAGAAVGAAVCQLLPGLPAVMVLSCCTVAVCSRSA